MTHATLRITEATQRLAQSRSGLRQALYTQSAHHGVGDTAFTSATALAWMAALHKVPGVEVLLEALQAWWLQQPLQPAGAATWDFLKETLSPVAKRYPLALVAVVAALGGLLAVSRPWRWAFKPTLLAVLLPQLLTAILAARTKPPENGSLF